MKDLVIVLLGLLSAGLSMLVWREQFRSSANRRIDRWDSLSGGWTAESVARYVHANGTWDPRILRWWNAEPGAPGPSTSVVVLLAADGKAMPDVSRIEGRLARFASRRRFAKAFKRHFGKALSFGGRDLQRVDGLGPLADGFVVLSDQPARGGATPDARAPRGDPPGLVRLGRHRRQHTLDRPVR